MSFFFFFLEVSNYFLKRASCLAHAPGLYTLCLMYLTESRLDCVGLGCSNASVHPASVGRAHASRARAVTIGNLATNPIISVDGNYEMTRLGKVGGDACALLSPQCGHRLVC